MKEWFVFDSLELLLLAIVLLVLSYRSVFLWWMTVRPLKQLIRERLKEEAADFSLPAVSVIVYADKRSDELFKNLPHILKQDYPDFEVVVVNDGADPEVKDVITYYQNTYDYLHSTYIPLHTQYVDHKKLALTLGIKAARNEVLLFTEGDCCPVGKDWISNMVKSGILQGRSFVYGNTHYAKGKGFLYQLTAYVSLKKHIRCWSSLFTHTPFLDNVRNMACLKSVLLDKGSDTCGIDLRVGRRELISAGIVTKENVKVAIVPGSAVTVTSPVTASSVKENLLALIGLRRYYSGAALFFSRFALVVDNLFPFIVLALLIVSGLFNSWGMLGILLLLVCIRFGLKLAVVRKTASLLQQPLMSSAFPFLEMMSRSFSACLRVMTLLGRS